ncbi:MAG: CapA family protein [Clostridia bacterium]|nr:CapA family protein [Clostridia bacterium]
MRDFKHNRMKLPEREEAFCLAAVGDLMLSRYVGQVIKKHQDHSYPFARVGWFLQGADLVFGNLENPITPGREIMIEEMKFRAEPQMARALKKAGFNVVSLANNHIADFGEQGIMDTMKYLDNAGVRYAGAGINEAEAYEPLFLEVKGYKIAVLAFNDSLLTKPGYGAGEGPGAAVLEPEKVAESVTKAVGEADFTMVYLHAGNEYEPEPDETQRYYARLAIDAGADLVLGSHPHVLQPVEVYRGKYIFYSLGNFIFDQLWSRETRESAIVKFYIRAGQVEKIEFLPVYIDDDARPVPLTGAEGVRVLDNLGLDLTREFVPAWDNEECTFIIQEQYVFEPGTLAPGYRLVQNRQLDLDGDGSIEKFRLKNGRVAVFSGPDLVWQSSEDWWVDCFFLGDSNNDGIEELHLLVWKQGSFGSYRPFWLEEEDNTIKNHLFIFKLEEGEIKPVWQSSNLDYPNLQAQLVDLNGDGALELMTLEGSYTDPNRREITLWQWNGWGFSLITVEDR